MIRGKLRIWEDYPLLKKAELWKRWGLRGVSGLTIEGS